MGIFQYYRKYLALLEVFAQQTAILVVTVTDYSPK